MFKNTGEVYDAGKHFDLIKSIAKDLPKGKCVNTIDNADLSGMKENDILLHFVKPNASLSLSYKELAKGRKVRAYQSVTKQFRTVLPTREQFTAELTFKMMMADLEAEDKEGKDDCQ